MLHAGHMKSTTGAVDIIRQVGRDLSGDKMEGTSATLPETPIRCG